MKPQEIVDRAISEGRKSLLEYEAYDVLSSYGIPVASYSLAKSTDEVKLVAHKIGYPLVLKIVSPDIIHKSDVGGVKLNITDDEQLRRSYEALIDDTRKNAPNAKIAGVLVEKMMPKSVEVVVGMIRDQSFGPTIMFGLGGVLVEIMKDVVFRIAPVSREESFDMIKKVKGYPLLVGYRGSMSLDIESLAELISNVSRIAMDIPEIDQMDLNPIIVYDKGLTVVDARIILVI
jgi:acetyl-CoA synthetase (ADP-forming)